MGLLEEMGQMFRGEPADFAGHGGPIGGHVEETRKMVLQAVATAPDVRIALPKDGCESCGYTPADDWSHVVGYSNAPIERYPFIPCPDCVGGHPKHNQIVVRARADLVAMTLSAINASNNGRIGDGPALKRMGARLSVATNTYEWVFRRESVRIPIPADASECFRDYKPLTPDGERAIVSPMKPEEMEVRFWVWRREVSGYSDYTIYSPNSNLSWESLAVDSAKTAKDSLMDEYSRAAANAIDRQILDDLNKATTAPALRKILDAYRSEPSEEQRVRDAALREAVVKPDLAKLKSMAPKGKRSLAQSLQDDIKKAIKKANSQ